MEKLVVHLEFGKILGIVSIISILITYIIHFIFRKDFKYKLVKYAPGFILILIGIYNLFNLGIDLPDTNEFNRVLATVIFLVAGFIGLFTGLIIGVINKDKVKES